jgi:hypothetical protein
MSNDDERPRGLAVVLLIFPRATPWNKKNSSEGDPTRAGRITTCSLAHIIEVEPLEAPANRNGNSENETNAS